MAAFRTGSTITEALRTAEEQQRRIQQQMMAPRFMDVGTLLGEGAPLPAPDIITLDFLLDNPRECPGAILGYVGRIAASLKLDPIKVNAGELLEIDREKFLPKIVDKRELNKRLSLLVGKCDLDLLDVKNLWPAYKKELRQICEDLSEGERYRLQEQVTHSRGRIGALSDEVSQLMQTQVAARRQLDNLRDDSSISEGIFKAIEKVIATDEDFQFVWKQGTQLYFVNVRDVVMCERNDKLDIDNTYNLGRFLVRLDLGSMALSVRPLYQNYIVNHYYHPYIDTANSHGTVCWGNMTNLAAEHFANYNFVELLSLLSKVMNTWSASTPYCTPDQLRVKCKWTWKKTVTWNDGSVSRFYYSLRKHHGARPPGDLPKIGI